MKVAVQCESPLLQRSLELFLAEHLSSRRHCDIIIRDYQSPEEDQLSFVIGSTSQADLIKPFSKAQLFHGVQSKLEASKNSTLATPTVNAMSETEDEPVSFEILERHIEKLTREYQANILKSIRAFYDK